MNGNRKKFLLGVHCLLTFFVTFAAVRAEEVADGTSQATAIRERAAQFELVPNFSMISPIAFRLGGGDRTLDYGSGFTAMPCVQIGTALRLGIWKSIDWRSQVSIGYGSKQALYPVLLAATGAQVSEDTARLHWVPALASVRGRYTIPSFTYMQPTLTLSGGMLYVAQRAKDPSLNASAVMPVIGITPALTFVDDSAPRDWFGGVVFGTTFLFSVGSAAHVRSMGIDLGININL